MYIFSCLGYAQNTAHATVVFVKKSLGNYDIFQYDPMVEEHASIQTNTYVFGRRLNAKNVYLCWGSQGSKQKDCQRRCKKFINDLGNKNNFYKYKKYKVYGGKSKKFLKSVKNLVNII